MTIQDLIAAVRISDPQLSPDGRLVAFVRTTTDLATGKRNADIWVVPADGSAPARLLIGGDKTDNTPRWSPDGKLLAFISTRDGEPADLSSPTPTAATSGRSRRSAGGVQPPLVFSPDGSSLAFVADVFPECTDEACNVQHRTVAEKNPVTAHSLTRLLYRHWDEWRDNVRHHVFVAPVGGGDARDLTPGDFDSPPTQQEDAAVAFTPDSQEIVFVSNREGIDKEAWTTNNDVWSVPVDRRHAEEADAQSRRPTSSRSFTPDGKFVIVRAQRRPGSSRIAGISTSTIARPARKRHRVRDRPTCR